MRRVLGSLPDKLLAGFRPGRQEFRPGDILRNNTIAKVARVDVPAQGWIDAGQSVET
jgi:hypothetical protein